MPGRRRNRNNYSGIEKGLSEANIRCDKFQTHWTKIQVQRIVKKIVAAMKRESPVFARLYARNFDGGSSYEGLKVREPEEFDDILLIDILLKIPKEAKPFLHEDVIPGFAQLQLQDFAALARREPATYSAMRNFVDHRNFLLTDPLKSFVQSIFDRALNTFANRVIALGEREYQVQILRVQNSGPAFTLTIEGLNLDFSIHIDLVPCILLSKKFWPKGGFRKNPYSEPSEFFIVPKKPNEDGSNRNFRLSFQMQERDIIFDRYWLKPTIRVMKCIRNHFNHENIISSYAIKTLFLWELFKDNPNLDDQTPELWKKSYSNCLVHMLEKYLQCLQRTENRIPYFWNRKLDLLGDLSHTQIDHCRRDIERMLTDIRNDPSRETMLSFLEE